MSPAYSPPAPQSADEMTVDDATSILLKGPNGFGKTIAACSMAAFGEVNLAYFDKSKPVELLDFFKAKYPKLLKNINVQVYSSANPHEYLNYLLYLREHGNPYYGLVTDSLTFFTSAAVNWSLADRLGGSSIDVKNVVPSWDEYKVETSLISQCLDLTKGMGCNNIWTAHPLPQLELKGQGTNISSVTKKNSLVSYGNKVGAMVPGAFTEIYHFGNETDWSTTPAKVNRYVYTLGIGDDFAKTSLGLPQKLDITDKLFWEVWLAAFKRRQEILNQREAQNEALKAMSK